MCNINGNQMRLLKSFPQTESAISIFATQHKIYQNLNLEYLDPVIGIFNFGSECISWLYKAIEKCLTLWMEIWQKNYNHNNNKAHKKIYICINIDNGKGN